MVTILEYCRKADPFDIGLKIDVPVGAVMELLETIQTSHDVKKLIPVVENFHGTNEKEIEELVLKFIKQSYESLKKR